MFFLSCVFLSCVNSMSLTDPFSNPVLVSTGIVFITIQLILISLNRTELMYPPVPPAWNGVIVPCSLWMFNWMLINAAASYLISWRRFSDSHNVLIYRPGHGPGWCGNHNKVEREWQVTGRYRLYAESLRGHHQTASHDDKRAAVHL